MPRPWKRGASCGARQRRRLPGDLERLARESGVETPTADLARLERKRKGKFPTRIGFRGPRGQDPKMKDGTTHLAYKPEHGLIADGGAVAVPCALFADSLCRQLGRSPRPGKCNWPYV